MKPVLITLAGILLFNAVFSQSKKERKLQKLLFCGYKYADSAKIRKHFGQQFDFLQIKDKDTVVDVGSSSGAYVGAINVIAPFKNVHFILVDIDSGCMNKTKVANMINHYEHLKGSKFDNSFSFVLNTPDSLYLPLHSFSKVLIFNTLHEITDKQNMARQLSSVIRKGGELIIAELAPTEKKTIHKGCDKPLVGETEIINLFGPLGFSLMKKLNLQPSVRKKNKIPYMFYRLLKI